jgi:hypothetical protein
MFPDAVLDGYMLMFGLMLQIIYPHLTVRMWTIAS